MQNRFIATLDAWRQRAAAIANATHCRAILTNGIRRLSFYYFVGVFVRIRGDLAAPARIGRLPTPLPLPLYTELVAQLTLLIAELGERAMKAHRPEDVHAASVHAQRCAAEMYLEKSSQRGLHKYMEEHRN